MLRASARATGVDIDLRSVGDLDRPPGRDDAAVLLRFTDALVGRTTDLDDGRAALGGLLGAEAVAFAAGAAGNFDMMNRVVDAAGVPISASMRLMAADLGLPGAG